MKLKIKAALVSLAVGAFAFHSLGCGGGNLARMLGDLLGDAWWLSVID